MQKSLSLVNKDLVFSSFKLNATSLEPIGSPSLDEWIACGSFVKKCGQSAHFWIGDWLNYGEGTFHEKYSQALEGTEYEFQTLANDKWIASKVAPSRRKEALTFTHHAEVAELDPEDQEKLLDQAEQEHLTTREFRTRVREYKIKIYAPELTDGQKGNEANDFKLVETVLDGGFTFLGQLKNINIEGINDNAKDYLISELKKITGILGGIVMKYGSK